MNKNYLDHYLYPGGLFVTVPSYRITTILGTCVAVCLWDSLLKVGGINHYLLPLWNGDGLASPRYGNIAIEKLVERMMENGSRLTDIQAKVFGGKIDDKKESVYNIGQRNIDLAFSTLKECNIPIVSKSIGGNKGRKILFFSDTGQVLMKYLNQ